MTASKEQHFITCCNIFPRFFFPMIVPWIF